MGLYDSRNQQSPQRIHQRANIDGGTAPDDDLNTSNIGQATQLLQPRYGLVRPNPTRERIYAIKQSGAGTSTTITTTGDCAGLIEIWVENNNTGTVGAFTKTNVWRVGAPVHFVVNGALGGVQDSKGNDNYLQSQGLASRCGFNTRQQSLGFGKY